MTPMRCCRKGILVALLAIINGGETHACPGYSYAFCIIASLGLVLMSRC